MFQLFGVGHEKKKEILVNQDDTNSETFGTLGQEEKEEVGQIALDVLENHESIYILAPVAGVELQDIEISVHDTILTISGIRNKPKEFYEHAMEIRNEECFWGRFLRNIILSENMDFSQIKAVMENNLLVIHIPKIRFESQKVRINRIAS